VAQIVLSDATALIYLAQIPEGLSILERLFGQVTITAIVKDEVLPQECAPGEPEIAEAIGRGLIAVIDDRWSEPTFPWLDEGEASTLRAAVNLANSGNQCLIIIDDKQGRSAAAELGSADIAVSATAAIIGRAREMGLIASAAAVFQQLREKGFRISDEIIREVLENIGEPMRPPPSPTPEGTRRKSRRGGPRRRR
jgi:predicted nucleic acid-binding protein